MSDSLKALLDQLVLTLRHGRIDQSFDLVQSWLKTARPGQLTALVNACPEQVRPRLTTLLRDVISGFPDVLFGCPILIHAAPDVELDEPAPPCLWLPSLDASEHQPCDGLRFEGWLSTDAELPVSLLPGPFKPTVPVPWRTSTSSVALFRHDHTRCAEESIDIPAEWWANLFRSTPGKVRLLGRMLLPYPDALEAARELQAAARGESLPGSGAFLRDCDWARDSGLTFAAECARQF